MQERGDQVHLPTEVGQNPNKMESRMAHMKADEVGRTGERERERERKSKRHGEISFILSKLLASIVLY